MIIHSVSVKFSDALAFPTDAGPQQCNEILRLTEENRPSCLDISSFNLNLTIYHSN